MRTHAIHIDWVASGTLDVEIEADTEEEAIDQGHEIEIGLSDRCGYGGEGFDVGYEAISKVRVE